MLANPASMIKLSASIVNKLATFGKDRAGDPMPLAPPADSALST
jgi:hypothetical protein